MNSEDIKRIEQWGKNPAHSVQLELAFDESPPALAFRRFCETLTENAPRAECKRVDVGPGDLPGIRVRNNLHYHAVPTGSELPPFLDALAGSRHAFAEIPGNPEIDAPASLKLYISAQCPFCPTVVREMLALPMHLPVVCLHVIDAHMFPDRADADRVKSVPVALLGDRFRWTGRFPISDVLQVLKDRTPNALDAKGFERILKEGNAAVVADMMMSANRLFPAFLEVLFHEKWPVRLGAMVVMEDLFERAPDIREQFVKPVSMRFDRLAPSVQGDMTYLLGLSRSTAAVSILEAVINGNYDPIVREAAREALTSSDFA